MIKMVSLIAILSIIIYFLSGIISFFFFPLIACPFGTW